MIRLKILLSKKIVGSTLLETITASIIFMIVFIMAMNTLTRLAKATKADAEYFAIENELKKCQTLICTSIVYPKSETYAYEWGEITIDILNYRNNIYQVNMIACTNKSHKKLFYRFLTKNP